MLAYMFQTYAEAMAMQLDVSCIPFATSSRGQTVNIIIFAHVEEGGLLYETCDDTESSNKYDDNSTLPPLISEEEMGAMSSGNEYYAEPMSTNMLEDIRDGGQFHRIINSRDARYKIHDIIKLIQVEWKGTLLSMRNIRKGLHKIFKAVVNDISQTLPIFGESCSEVSYLLP